MITVITAVYNDDLYIYKSVRSILQQTFRDFEYIIIDDGSSDGTLGILRNLASLDTRIRILTQNNMGPAVARNAGILAARGTYIALQDSDDISEPTRLQKQLDFLIKRPLSLSCTSHNIIDTSSHVIASSNKIYKNINQNVLRGSLCFCTPTLMMKKDAIVAINGYNEFYKKSEDFDLILRLLESGYLIEKLNECLYNYRIRINSEGSKNNGAYATRAYENHLRRTKKQREDFTFVKDDFQVDPQFIVKRQAGEIFYAENFSEYIRYYLKHFNHLRTPKFFFYFTFSLLPNFLKRGIKSLR